MNTPDWVQHAALLDFVRETAELTRPASVHWVDGSAEENDRLCRLLEQAGTFTRLDPAKRPNSFAAFSSLWRSPEQWGETGVNNVEG